MKTRTVPLHRIHQREASCLARQEQEREDKGVGAQDGIPQHCARPSSTKGAHRRGGRAANRVRVSPAKLAARS